MSVPPGSPFARLPRGALLAAAATLLVACGGGSPDDDRSGPGRPDQAPRLAPAGPEVDATAPDFGRLEVDPPAGQITVGEGEVFHCRLRWEAGAQGLPPGWALAVYPMPNAVHEGSVDLQVSGGLRMRPEAYFSRSTTDLGSVGRYVIGGVPDVRAGDGFVLDLRTTFPRQFYGRAALTPLVVSVVVLDPAGEIAHRFPSPDWRRAPEPAARLRALLPSQAAVGEDVSLLVTFASWKHNAVYEDCGAVQLELPDGAEADAQELTVSADARGVVRVALRFQRAGVQRVRVRSTRPTASGERFDVLSNPIAVSATAEERRVLRWGDLQNHSIYSFDSRTRAHMGMSAADEAVDARDRYALDFVTLSDHMQTRQVRERNEAPDGLDMPLSDWSAYGAELLDPPLDGIHAFLGYEQSDYRGHTVMVNRGAGPYPNAGERRPTYDMYWALKGERDLLSIPHLHPLLGLDVFDRTSPCETLVEVCSQHGSYEYYLNEPYEPLDSIKAGRGAARKHDLKERGPFVRELLDKGFRYGLVGSSDHGVTGAYGLTAVFVEADTRDGVFDALLARRCYATTGARILLDFQVDGHAMGREVRVDPAPGPRAVRATVHAQGPIERIQVVRNGAVWREVRDVASLDWSTTFVDEEPLDELLLRRPIGAEATAYYYLRVVQADGHIAWSSPVFLVAE